MFNGYGGLLTERFSKLLSGEMKPYELPEFKGMEYTLAKRGALARKGAGRQMRQQGIRGPAVGATLSRMEEQETTPLGQAMQATYGQLPGQAMSWQGQLDARKMFERQQYQMHRERKQARQVAKSGQMSGACCFIFIEADNGKLNRIARKWRDENGTPKAKSGYRRLANWLVPKMRESKAIKNLVRFFMVKPMIGAGGFVYRKNHWGYLFVPLAIVWMMVFEMLGLRKNHDFLYSSGV